MYKQSENDCAVREANRKVIERYFQLAHNSEELISLYAPDCQWEQPFFRPNEVTPMFPADDGDFPPLPEGFEPPEFTPEWHWDDNTQIWGTDDPNFFFASNTGHGLQLNGNNELRPYANRYFHTFRLRDGKIIFYQEITNPLNLMDSMGVHHDPFPQPEETLKSLIAKYEREHTN